MSTKETKASTERIDDDEAEEPGDAACWAHLVCPECGAVESEGHRPGCSLAAAEKTGDS